MPRRAAVVADDPPLGDAMDQDQLPLDPPPARRAAGRPRKAAAKRAPAKRTGTRGQIAVRTPSGTIMSKTQMQTKVRGEIEMYLNLAAAGWSLRDPICASSASEERIAKMADALVAMISRDDKLLAYAAKSGILGDIAMFCNAAWPIAKEVYRHHGPGGDGHGDALPMTATDDPHLANAYPAFNGTRR
jgi:hypothetical protein